VAATGQGYPMLRKAEQKGRTSKFWYGVKQRCRCAGQSARVRARRLPRHCAFVSRSFFAPLRVWIRQ
jgi:hypothetical protein